MNVHSTAPTEPDAFLRWNQDREGKRELVNGRVVEMMINVTRWHSFIVTRLLIELAAVIDPGRFEVHAADFGMKTPDGVRFPDIVVDAAGGSGKDLAVNEPVLVCEVLSPSSVVIDTVEKLSEYTRVASLQHYLVLSQDEPRGWLWSRTEVGWQGPDVIAGPDGRLSLSALSVDIALAKIYPASLLR